MTRSFHRIAAAVMAVAVGLASPLAAWAQQRGPVTNLPLPRFVSLKTNEANARRGPDLSHRIDWVYKRRDMPLRVTAEFEHWRRIEDMDGKGGWIHSALLSGERTALVQADMAPLRVHPDADARDVALLEQGVIGVLQSCEAEWCELQIGNVKGWLPISALWGVEPGELLN
ncbi:SH3 domain-containing protein [Roseinatronobacter sp.]|uniref:SH3 domain-containing protein n=1 Tax=Roseinatronobacter sp. TaxID=1945755 RepID=UPI0025D0301A|nr:SH3 domain-containing protein [Roseibaca sp.]